MKKIARWNNVNIVSRSFPNERTNEQSVNHIEFDGTHYAVTGITSNENHEVCRQVADKINSGEAQEYSKWWQSNKNNE